MRLLLTYKYMEFPQDIRNIIVESLKPLPVICSKLEITVWSLGLTKVDITSGWHKPKILIVMDVINIVEYWFPTYKLVVPARP